VQKTAKDIVSGGTISDLPWHRRTQDFIMTGVNRKGSGISKRGQAKGYGGRIPPEVEAKI